VTARSTICFKRYGTQNIHKEIGEELIEKIQQVLRTAFSLSVLRQGSRFPSVRFGHGSNPEREVYSVEGGTPFGD